MYMWLWFCLQQQVQPSDLLILNKSLHTKTKKADKVPVSWQKSSTLLFYVLLNSHSFPSPLHCLILTSSLLISHTAHVQSQDNIKDAMLWVENICSNWVLRKIFYIQVISLEEIEFTDELGNCRFHGKQVQSSLYLYNCRITVSIMLFCLLP